MMNDAILFGLHFIQKRLHKEALKTLQEVRYWEKHFSDAKQRFDLQIEWPKLLAARARYNELRDEFFKIKRAHDARRNTIWARHLTAQKGEQYDWLSPTF